MKEQFLPVYTGIEKAVNAGNVKELKAMAEYLNVRLKQACEKPEMDVGKQVSPVNDVKFKFSK